MAIAMWACYVFTWRKRGAGHICSLFKGSSQYGPVDEGPSSNVRIRADAWQVLNATNSLLLQKIILK
jgi:hypothetical protein